MNGQWPQDHDENQGGGRDNPCSKEKASQSANHWGTSEGTMTSFGEDSTQLRGPAGQMMRPWQFY